MNKNIAWCIGTRTEMDSCKYSLANACKIPDGEDCPHGRFTSEDVKQWKKEINNKEIFEELYDKLPNEIKEDPKKLYLFGVYSGLRANDLVSEIAVKTMIEIFKQYKE